MICIYALHRNTNVRGDRIIDRQEADVSEMAQVLKEEGIKPHFNAKVKKWHREGFLKRAEDS